MSQTNDIETEPFRSQCTLNLARSFRLKQKHNHPPTKSITMTMTSTPSTGVLLEKDLLCSNLEAAAAGENACLFDIFVFDFYDSWL